MFLKIVIQLTTYLKTKLRDIMPFGSANLPVPLNFDAEKEMVDTD